MPDLGSNRSHKAQTTNLSSAAPVFLRCSQDRMRFNGSELKVQFECCSKCMSASSAAFRAGPSSGLTSTVGDAEDE